MENSENDNLLKRAFVTRTQGFIDVSQKTGFWKQLAGEKGGEFAVKQTVAKDQKILVLTLPCKGSQVIFTESDTHPLKIKCRLTAGRELEFFAGKKDFLDKVFGFLTAKTLKTGDKVFDDRYVLRGKPESDVLRIFSNDELRRNLVENDVYSLSCEYDRTGRAIELMCVVNRTVNSKEQLAELYRLSCLVIEEIIRTAEE